MSRLFALRAGASVAVVTALVVAGITAFACVPIAILRLAPADQPLQPAGQLVPVPQLAPGAKMTAFIHEISGDGAPPVSFHWDSVDGPVLATAVPTDDPGISATITVPENATPGYHTIVATEPRQQASTGEYPTWGLPVKAALVVTGPGAVAPASTTVPPGPSTLNEGGIGVALLVLIAIATALVAAGIALGAAWLLRRPAPSGQSAPKR